MLPEEALTKIYVNAGPCHSVPRVLKPSPTLRISVLRTADKLELTYCC
jgi:hypothetical protein